MVRPLRLGARGSVLVKAAVRRLRFAVRNTNYPKSSKKDSLKH